MKKKCFYTGLILLLITYFILDRSINTGYNDYKKIRVKDNELIVLKRNNDYGILRLKNQSMDPQKAGYEWFLTGRNKIRPDDKSSYLYGSGITGDDVEKGKLTPVAFGAFKFYWSPRTDGEGFLYLNYYPEFNEQNGPFSWAKLSKRDIDDSVFISAEPEFRVLTVKKRNVFFWIFDRD